MPGNRLTYEQAALRGSTATNPGRFASRKNSPPTTGTLGTAPRHLSADAKKIWRELAHLIPVGVAGEADRLLLEVAANTLAEYRANPTAMRASRLSILIQTLGRLGLDPQARTKLQTSETPTTKSKTADSYDVFMAANDEDE